MRTTLTRCNRHCADSPGCLRHRIAALIVVGGMASALIGAAIADENDENRPPPNIVLILADDLGYAELGCYGQKWIKTPNIDRLAKEGMRFTQHYSGNAVCATARCVLMTGKHTGHAYIRSNGNPKGLEDLREKFGWEFPGQHPIPDEEVTIAEVLKSKGYATAAAGKWGLGHFGTTGDPTTQGFDLFYGFNCQVHAHNHYPKFLWRNRQKEVLPGNDRTLYGETYSQDKFVEVGLQFIRDNQDRPFFLYLPFAVPHLSIQVPEESLAQYKGKIPEHEYKHRGYLKHPYPHAGYAAMISHMDRGVGSIVKLIDELGLSENTLIIFSSDNGPTYDRLGGSDSEFFQSAGPLRGFKGSLYEGGIREPMIARWKDHIAAGTETDLPSAFWDVLPTLAEIAGVAAPRGIDGISFAPTLLGRADQQVRHEFLYWEFPSYGGQQAVRVGPWKGVRQNMLRKGNPDPLKIELYNLESDIGEQHDMAAEHPEIVAKIARIMREQHTPSRLWPMPPLDNQ
jgi:arylsulfatase A-like enzyme